MIYQKEYTLTCFDVDYNDNMRPTSFMEYSQDMAEIATEESGYGYKNLKELGVGWVVIRMHSIFHKAAHLGDVVKMSTWHRGTKGPFFVRDYQMSDINDELIASSTSSWVVMDMESRSLARDQRLDGVIPKTADCDEAAIEELCPKIIMPKDGVKLIGTHKVVWSDVDHNHHANNVRYIVWAMDALPSEIVYHCPLKESFVNFNKEVAPGETVELYHYCDNDFHIIEGKVDDTQVFICKLLFAKA